MPAEGSKKRLCPECDKEFEDNPELGETPCCKFPIRSFDTMERIRRAQSKAQKQDQEEADKKAKEETDKKAKEKKKGLSSLGGILR